MSGDKTFSEFESDLLLYCFLCFGLLSYSAEHLYFDSVYTVLTSVCWRNGNQSLRSLNSLVHLSELHV